jgi:hypothetical protein
MMRGEVYELFEMIRDMCGGPEDVDALMVYMLTKYSEEYKFKAPTGSVLKGCGVKANT